MEKDNRHNVTKLSTVFNLSLNPILDKLLCLSRSACACPRLSPPRLSAVTRSHSESLSVSSGFWGHFSGFYKTSESSAVEIWDTFWFRDNGGDGGAGASWVLLVWRQFDKHSRPFDKGFPPTLPRLFHLQHSVHHVERISPYKGSKRGKKPFFLLKIMWAESIFP